MRRSARMMLVLCTLGLNSCALWFQHTHPLISRSLDVADPPDVAFTQAVGLTLQMGGTIWTQDAKTRTLQAFLNQAKTQLNVRVLPRGQGSRLEVSHQHLPTYVVAGDDGTLSDDFLARYTQQAAARR